MKIIKGVLTYTMLLIGGALIICMALIGCMFLFPNFKVFGWGVMFQSNKLVTDIKSEKFSPESEGSDKVITLDIDAKLHDVEIYQFSDSTEYITIQKYDDMFGLMKGSRDNYDGSVTLDKVEDGVQNHFKVETKAIEGAILKRTSRIVVYVPNRQSYVFNISTTNGNITINGGLKEVAGKVETATNLKVYGLNLKTTSGDFSWNNIYNKNNEVPLNTLIAKTNTGKFDFTLADNITLKSTGSQYYLECKRGEFLFNNINANKVNIVGDDVLIRANKLHTEKSFYFNAPSGFFDVTTLTNNDNGLSTIITNNIDVKLDTVNGELAITTTYGDITVNKTMANATLKSINGNISVGEAKSSLSAISEHGDITVGKYSEKVYLKNKHGKIVATFDTDATRNYENSSTMINEEGSITANKLILPTTLTTTAGGTINASYSLLPTNTTPRVTHEVNLQGGGKAYLQMPNTNAFKFSGQGNISGRVSSQDMVAGDNQTILTPAEDAQDEDMTLLTVRGATGATVFSTYSGD